MNTKHHDAWTTGWTPQDPPAIGYVSAPHDWGAWEKGFRPYLEYRDLGLKAASAGKLGVQHIRVVGTPKGLGEWHCHDVDFQFFYVLNGAITIENEHGDKHTLSAGDSGYHPPLYWHREFDFTEDYECVEITCPADAGTIVGRGSKMPERAQSLDPDRRAVYTSDRPDTYARGAGPRSFFLYRDLGTREPTNGRVHVHVVRATAPGNGTGWHYHSMAQWFMVLRGSSYIRVEDKPPFKLEALDSMCIGAGPSMRHNVAPFTGDYQVLEMCIPAEYETIGVDPPDRASAPPEGAREGML